MVKVTAKSVIIEAKTATITNNSVIIDLKDTYSIGGQYLHFFNYEDEKYLSVYNINKIDVKNNKVFLIEKELNDVYKYILPVLNLSKHLLLTEYMYDCRIKDDLIYLFYRFVPYEDYLTRRDKIKYCPNYVNCIIPEDKRLECFVFKLNLLEEIHKLINNQLNYSKEYIFRIAQFHGMYHLYTNIISNSASFRQQFANDLDVSVDDLPELLKEKFNFKENML